MHRIALSLLLIALLVAGPLTPEASAQWAPEAPVVLRGKVVSMHTRVRQGQVVIRDGKIEAILPRPPSPPPARS